AGRGAALPSTKRNRFVTWTSSAWAPGPIEPCSPGRAPPACAAVKGHSIGVARIGAWAVDVHRLCRGIADQHHPQRLRVQRSSAKSSEVVLRCAPMLLDKGRSPGAAERLTRRCFAPPAGEPSLRAAEYQFEDRGHLRARIGRLAIIAAD